MAVPTGWTISGDAIWFEVEEDEAIAADVGGTSVFSSSKVHDM